MKSEQDRLLEEALRALACEKVANDLLTELPRSSEPSSSPSSSPRSSLAQALGKKLNQAETELSSTSENMRVAQRQIVSLNIELEQALQSLQQLEDEIKMKNETIKEQAATVDELNEVIEGLEKESNQNKSTDKLNTELDDARKEIEANSNLRGAMEAELKGMKKNLEFSMESQNQSQLELKALKKQMKSQAHTIDELHEVISGLEAEKDALKKETDVLIHELKDQVTNAHDNHPLHAEMKSNRAEVLELYEVIEGLELELREERAKFEELVASNSDEDDKDALFRGT